jgi:hypothetical protein
MSRPATWLAPPDWDLDGSRAVFVKFLEADHQLQIDARGSGHVARSVIRFESFECGFPLFDLAAFQVGAARIDGYDVGLRFVSSPDGVTEYRMLDAALEPGEHHLEIVQAADEGIVTWNGRVTCRLRFRDRVSEDEPHPTERFFLERYLPANLEFDRHPRRIAVRITNSSSRHRVISNGSVCERSKNDWIVTFPDWFCSSSPYLRVVPSDAVHLALRQFETRSRAAVAIEVYGSPSDPARVAALADAAVVHLDELDESIGAFPFERLVVFDAGIGMEYAGACDASLDNLRHELVHNYFGRCLAPVDGNAGWVDAAIASWCTGDWRRAEGDSIGRNLGNRSVYARATAPDAGRIGAGVLDRLDREIGASGGIAAFLRWWYARRRQQQFTARSFQRDLEEFAGMSLEKLFQERVYGGERA